MVARFVSVVAVTAILAGLSILVSFLYTTNCTDNIEAYRTRYASMTICLHSSRCFPRPEDFQLLERSRQRAAKCKAEGESDVD